uniref:Uncharacterized protein n=2 Tax=Oryza TaxID=4527 RepID=A0A0E0C887_9ORYZ
MAFLTSLTSSRLSPRCTMRFRWNSPCFTRLNSIAPARVGSGGMAGSLAGSAALRVHAMRSVSSDMPSPREWCTRIAVVAAASDVGKSSTWNSHSGRDSSMGLVDSDAT